MGTPLGMIHFGNQISPRRRIEYTRPPVTPRIDFYFLQAITILTVYAQRDVINSGAVINHEEKRPCRPNCLGWFETSGTEDDYACR